MAMFGIKEKVEAVKAIPDQIRTTALLALSALIVALIALAMSANGVRNAH